VRVYAYQVSDLTLRRVDTDNVGTFVFEQLPAGLYKIIAFKTGFVPAVVLLSRETPEVAQYLEVDLSPQSAAAAVEQDSFWSLRQKIPRAVLRDLETIEIAADEPMGSDDSRTGLLETRLEALTGSDSAVEDSIGMSRGQVAMTGTLGSSDFGLTGDYWLAPSKQSRDENSYASEVSLSLDNPNGSRVRLTTVDNSLSRATKARDSVDLERYQVSWSQDLGPGTSTVKAELVEEANLYASGPIRIRGLPDSSRTWNVEGSYTGDLTRNDSLNAGFRYRQWEGYDISPAARGYLPSQRVDLFGLAATRIKPRFLLQYGMYSTLRDGSLSLAPQGGVVVELGSNWTASTLASHRVHQDEPVNLHDFLPVAYSSTGTCQSEEYCYQIEVSRSLSRDGDVTFGATHRRFGETMRLYFSEDFFNHMESLYLAEGDTLPEVTLALTQRITPNILAQLRSNVATGGGGTLYASRLRAYENNVSYLVTSLDTQFERTNTGVFLAFHHLEQSLDPLATRRKRRTLPVALEMQRLQLRLTQDLSMLNMDALALRLNLEVARGSNPAARDKFDEDELHKRVMGGVAVTF
jgi:hypothetical protein